MYYSTTYSSPIGIITLVCDDHSLIGLWNEDQKYHGASILEKAIRKDDHPVFEKSERWLESYFHGEEPNISDLALAPIGGEFRQAVWKILCNIPYGEVISYGDIAKQLAKDRNKKTMSAQAVGGAVGHNPISIIIPCHRVVGANGSLTGYAGGLQKKIKLLELEGVDISSYFIPKKGTAL